MGAGRGTSLWLNHLSCPPYTPLQCCSGNAAACTCIGSTLSSLKPWSKPALTLIELFLSVVQFTGDWESGWVTANTSYKSFSCAVVNVDIGLHVGLAGVNITLVGEYHVPFSSDTALQRPLP